MTSEAHDTLYSTKLRYLASAFVDAQSIVANTADMATLLTKIDDERLLPGSVQELSSTGTMPRIAFSAPDDTLQLVLLGSRFDYSRLATDPEGSDLGEFSAFCQDAAAKLTIALAHFQRKAHRLAAIQEGYLRELDSAQVNHVLNRLLNLPEVYREHLPAEWDWRAIARIERGISDLVEPTNTITTIRRTVGRYIHLGGESPVQVDVDRIRVDFDINTLPTATSARFATNHVHSFFDQATSWHADLSSEVLSFISPR